MAKEDISGKVENLLSEYLQDKDLEVYRVEYRKEGPDWKLRVIIDKTENAESMYVGIDECEAVTRFLSDRLDETDLIDRIYTLEVSSPGLDRELTKESDFKRFAGHEVEVRLYEQVDGAKQLTGELVGIIDGFIVINADGKEYSIPQKKVSKINLAIVF